MDNICKRCFHNYVCDEYNADRDFPRTVCAYYNSHFVDAADVVEVRHGRWMTTDAYPHHLYCSVCYKTYAKNAKWVNELDLPTNYCPNCGARMGKEDEHEAD